jgi:hypothetical protein
MITEESDETLFEPDVPKPLAFAFARDMNAMRMGIEWGGIQGWTVRTRRAVQVQLAQPADSRRSR